MLKKMLEVVTGGPQTRLASLKKSQRNTLKFISRNRSDNFPYLVLESFSCEMCSCALFLLDFPTNVTNTKIQLSWRPQSCTNDTVIEYLL
jgi:hypothetical protein